MYLEDAYLLDGKLQFYILPFPALIVARCHPPLPYVQLPRSPCVCPVLRFLNLSKSDSFLFLS